MPVLAQAPDLQHLYAHPPIVIGDTRDPSRPGGILPQQFKAAYGFNLIPNQGQGQTIALIDAFDDPNIEADLEVYKNTFHIGPCNFQKVKIGNPQPRLDWTLEEALDVEQACALAPQANLVLVEGEINSYADLLNANRVAYSAPYNATIVSNSWGGLEFQGEQGTDSYFCNVVNGNGQPVIFTAASGDTGHGLLYPSTSPCVVGVGGTTLALATALPSPNPLQLNYGSETAWNSTGGGLSAFELQPVWQRGVCLWSGSARCAPDVASDADRAPGVPAYESYYWGGWLTVGGTSVATPDWAAFFAIVSSLRANAGKGPLSQVLPDLYAIYASDYADNFHDITAGHNGNCGPQCDAQNGYDLLTGVGSYQANRLAASLLAVPE